MILTFSFRWCVAYDCKALSGILDFAIRILWSIVVDDLLDGAVFEVTYNRVCNNF